jgi:O-antigen/teichoic acid export membrane protein
VVFLDKILKLGQISASGGFHLFLGKILSTVILAIGTIILGIFILEGDYGLYTIAAVPAATILLFQDWGVGTAMIRYCAQCRAANNEGALRRIISAGLTFEVASGIVLTIVSLLMSNFIASTVFGKPESAILITLVSVTILSTSIYNATQSIFIGFEQMKYNSFVMICQALAQGTFAPVLVYLGYGAFGAVLGYTLGSMAVCTFSVIMLYFGIFKKLKNRKTDDSGLLQVLKSLLRYGVPLAIGTILGGLLTQFYSFMMASFCSDAIIGNYKVALNFGIFLTFFIFPISTVLFPVFSKLNPTEEKEILKTVFSSSVKYAAFLLVPATLAMIVLARPLIGALYANKWLDAPWFLVLSVVGNLFMVFGSLSVQSLLAGVGETKLLMKVNLLGISIGIPIGFVFVPLFGMVGVLVGLIISSVPVVFISLYFAWKRYGVKVDFRSSSRILLASLIAALVTFLLISLLNVAYWLQLASGMLLFLAVYLFCAPLLGAINLMDLNNLRTIMPSSGIISKPLRILLTIMERTLTFRARCVAKQTQ